MNVPKECSTTHVYWLLQQNQADSADLRAVVDALNEAGQPSHLIVLQKGTEIPAVPELPEHAPVVCLGPAFVPRAMRYPRLRSGLFYDPATFRWSAYQLGWRDEMLSRDACVVPLARARAMLQEHGRAFLRPDADSKVFDGGLYDVAGFQDATQRTNLCETTPVVFASPIKIEVEWRFFVVNREVIGCSEYRRWGQMSTQGSVPRAAIEFACECASNWGPSNIYCLDVGEAEGCIGIVEANCFNASRFYGAPIDRIVGAVNAHVLDRFCGK